jgi:hypothetical protein
LVQLVQFLERKRVSLRIDSNDGCATERAGPRSVEQVIGDDPVRLAREKASDSSAPPSWVLHRVASGAIGFGLGPPFIGLDSPVHLKR